MFSFVIFTSIVVVFMIIAFAKIAQTADSAKQMAKYFMLGAAAVRLCGGLAVVAYRPEMTIHFWVLVLSMLARASRSPEPSRTPRLTMRRPFCMFSALRGMAISVT